MIKVSRIRLALYGLGALTPEQKARIDKNDRNKLNRIHAELQDEINDLKIQRFNAYFDTFANKVDGWCTEQGYSQDTVAGFLRGTRMGKGDKCTANLETLHLTQKNLDDYLKLRGFEDNYMFNESAKLVKIGSYGKDVQC